MKSHLKVTTDDEDGLIQAMISAARDYLETHTRRQFLTATYQLQLDYFPGHIFYGSGWMYNTPLLRERAWEYGRYFFDRQIWLPRPFLQSITSINYLDTNGNAQVLPPSQYVVDNVMEPGRVAPAYNCYWPDTYAQINAVQINYVSGYTMVPQTSAANNGIQPPRVNNNPILQVQGMGENTTSVQTNTAHGLSVGDTVSLVGLNEGQYNLSGVTVTAVESGYEFEVAATVSDVPAPGGLVICSLLPFGLVQAMKFLVGHWYENRTSVTPGALIEVPMALEALINANKCAHMW